MKLAILLLAFAAILVQGVRWDCQTNDVDDNDNDREDEDNEDCTIPDIPTEVCKLVRHRRDQLPEGYIMMTIQDVRNNFDDCKAALSTFPWAIVALLDGKVAGSGYRYEIQTGSDFLNCRETHKFIMTDDCRPDQNIEDC